MKAIQVQAYGNFEQLRYANVSMPPMGVDDVLVRVYAASVNHIDPLRASGAVKHIYPLAFPWTPGRDFAGTIEQVGSAVTDFRPGDAVYGDSVAGGSYADYVVVKSDVLSHKPQTLSFWEAAAAPVAAVTAWQSLFLHGQLKAGQTVVIHGGAGGVGGYAVQLAHQHGATVIATASLDDLSYVRSLGANQVLDYRTTDLREWEAQVDLVLDLVGGPVQQRSYGLLKAGGRLIATNQPVSAEEAAKHQVMAAFIHVHAAQHDLNRLSSLFEQEKLHVDIARTYPLEAAAVAWQDLARNLPGSSSVEAERTRITAPKTHGKIVLEML